MPLPGVKTFEDLAARAIRDEHGCLVWQGSSGGRPGRYYGNVKFGGRVQYVHRVAFILAGGMIPADLHGKRAVLDHGCRNRLCIEPTHLRLMTDQENILLGDGVAARHAAKITCSKHNETLVFTAAQRVCRSCRREARARWAVKNPGWRERYLGAGPSPAPV